MKQLSNFKISRPLHKFEDIKSKFLTGFCDASEGTYCAAVYTKFEDKNSTVSPSLLRYRTRVASIKKLTILRLPRRSYS